MTPATIARLAALKAEQQHAARLVAEHEDQCPRLGTGPCDECISLTQDEHIAFNRWANARLRKPKAAARSAAGGEAT